MIVTLTHLYCCFFLLVKAEWTDSQSVLWTDIVEQTVGFFVNPLNLAFTILHSNFVMKPSRIFIAVPLVKVVWTDIEQTDNDS